MSGSMRVCVRHDRELEEEHRECLWCELERVKALARRCAVELSYIQGLASSETDLYASPVGQECIEDVEKELGEMRYWPEIANA